MWFCFCKVAPRRHQSNDCSRRGADVAPDLNGNNLTIFLKSFFKSSKCVCQERKHTLNGVALNPGRIRCELHWKLHLTLNIKTQRGVRGNFIFTLNFISLGLEFSFHFRCDFASTIIHRFGDSVWLGLLAARMKSEVVNLFIGKAFRAQRRLISISYCFGFPHRSINISLYLLGWRPSNYSRRHYRPKSTIQKTRTGFKSTQVMESSTLFQSHAISPNHAPSRQVMHHPLKSGIISFNQVILSKAKQAILS